MNYVCFAQILSCKVNINDPIMRHGGIMLHMMHFCEKCLIANTIMSQNGVIYL